MSKKTANHSVIFYVFVILKLPHEIVVIRNSIMIVKIEIVIHAVDVDRFFVQKLFDITYLDTYIRSPPIE